MMLNGKAIILDTETTGTENAQPIEVAWCGVSDPLALDGTLESFCRRYKPSVPIEFGAMATHHIMEEDLVDCPPAGSFEFPVDVEYLIGHKIDFDWEVIGHPSVKRICTLALARHVWPEGSHTIGALIYRFHRAQAREWLRAAHSAAADIEFCRLILVECLRELRARGVVVDTWEQVWAQSEVARIPTIMPFGKHSGTPIAKVPPDYKRWLLGQPDVDPYLRKALQS